MLGELGDSGNRNIVLVDLIHSFELSVVYLSVCFLVYQFL